MKILVTGATGFIGSHVAVHLANAGHQVVATGRNPAKVPALGSVPNLRLAHLDLKDRSDWDAAFEGCEALVHIALGWGDEASTMLAADTAASVALFEAAHIAGAKKIIYTSSTAANGEMEALNSEDRQNRPTDYYGATKAATEMFARAFAHTKGVEMQVIRPGYIFGEPVVPGSSVQADTRFRAICRAVHEGRPVKLVKHDGTQFLHADDIALVYERLLGWRARFSIHYALASGWVSWAEVAGYAMEIAGRTVPIELEDRGYAPEPYLFDVRAIERDFGLRFSNRERLRGHLRWELGRADA